MKRICAAICFGFIAVAQAIAASPESPAPDELAEQLRQAKATIVEADSEGRKILGSLYAINRRMKKISREKSNLTDELFSMQGNAKGTAKAIAELEERIAGQRTDLRKRLRALYKLSGENYVAILFSQSSPEDLDHAMRGLRNIADRDYRLLRAYQKNIEARREQRTRLKSQVKRLVALERKIRDQEGRLLAEHRAKTAAVSGLEKSKAAEIERLQALREKTSVVGGDEKISALLKASFFESKGKLPAPVSVGGAPRVALGFGVATDERTKTQIVHKGWHLVAPRGSSVLAVFEGTITFSGWIPGLGNVIVLDHGDHYYTVYGHTARVKLKVGDSVKRGQTIGEVGASAWRDGDGLYFEIRHFSDSQDPARWIQTNGVRIASETSSPPTASSGLARLSE